MAGISSRFSSDNSNNEKMIEQTTPTSVLLRLLIAIIVGLVLGFIAWCKYSSVQRKKLKKDPFTTMEIVSETRDEFGDRTRIPKLARTFSRRVTKLGSSFRHLNGHKFDSLSKQGSIRVKGNVAVQYSHDDEQSAIYGREKPPDLSLQELVGEKTTKMEVEEDVFKRMNWIKKIEECVPVNGEDEKNKDAMNLEGMYFFCHRDYVNYEELMGMMCKRGGIEAFFFKPSRADELLVDKDSQECVLLSSSKLFRFIPISIEWKGKLEKGTTIHWYTTSLMMGWESFGKFFDKPPAAEKLRKDPWHVYVPKDDSTGDILCLKKEGKGHLVFAKEKCLSKGTKCL